MKAVRKLATCAAARWKEKRGDEEAFPDVAVSAFEEEAPRITPHEILAALHRGDVPPQFPTDNDFGQPPVTLYRDERFYIEALFWLDGTTAIHQHGFSGAFHVLAGSSIHSEYEFEALERVNGRVIVGTMSARTVQWLHTGCTKPIRAGRNLIHSLFHLERPSVTLVLRTHRSLEAQPQFEYWKPLRARATIARDPFDFRPLLRRQLQGLELLRQVDEPAYRNGLVDLIGRVDFDEILTILNANLPYVTSVGCFPPLLRAAQQRFGTLANHLVPVFEERRRQFYIRAQRKRVHKPEHRFLLALLLTAPPPGVVMDLIRRHFDVRDPITCLCQWVKEMSVDEERTDGANGLFVDDGTAEVLEAMLRLGDARTVVSSLEAKYGKSEIDRERERIEELCALIPLSEMLAPLFVQEAS